MICSAAAYADCTSPAGPEGSLDYNTSTHAFQYCDNAYAKLNDAKAAETVKFFGMNITRLGAMDFNTAHTLEHYGNLVTYMRLKNIVPPSSTPRPPAAKK